MPNRDELIDILVNQYNEDPSELSEMTTQELEELLDEIEDTSPMHPNETDEEFAEHEDW